MRASRAAMSSFLFSARTDCSISRNSSADALATLSGVIFEAGARVAVVSLFVPFMPVGGGDDNADGSGLGVSVGRRDVASVDVRMVGTCEEGGGVREAVLGATSNEVLGDAARSLFLSVGRSRLGFCGVEGVSTGVDVASMTELWELIVTGGSNLDGLYHVEGDVSLSIISALYGMY